MPAMLSLSAMRVELSAALVSDGLDAADELCRACVSLLEVDGAAISVVHQGTAHGTFGASSERSRRLDDHQFTYGEGPCLDAARSGAVVMATDLDSAAETRWPGYSGAVLDEGIRSVFALPILAASVWVGALDLFRDRAGPLRADHLGGALVAAELVALPLLRSLTGTVTDEPVGTAEGGGGPADDGEAVAQVDRVEVYQATGMLISQLDVSADEALARLRAHAVATGQTASQVAWAIIERRLVLERDQHDLGGA